MDGSVPQIPVWLETSRAVMKYGAMSVFGRVLTVEETRKMNVATDIEMAYISRASADNLRKWADAHPYYHKLLTFARNWAIELEYVTDIS